MRKVASKPSTLQHCNTAHDSVV